MTLWTCVAMAACSTTVVTNGERQNPGTEQEHPGSCEFISDALELSFRTGDGRTSACGVPSMNGNEDIVVSGTILNVDGGWTIDSCPPDSDCTNSVTTVSVSGGGSLPNIGDGAMVELTIREVVDSGGDCFGQSIWIDNLATWEGFENPVSSGAHRWLYVGFGIASLPVDGPFAVERVAACGADGEDHQTQRVEDVLVTAGDASVRVGQGVDAEITVESGESAGRYAVKNVRCQYGCCHGGPCEFWIARTAP